MALVWDRFPGSGSQLLTALALADWCDDHGGSLYPSVGAVATKLRTSESQARRLLHSLIAENWLAVIGNANGGRPGDSRRYQLNVDRLASAPIVTAAMRDPAAPRAFAPRVAAEKVATTSTDATPGTAATPSTDAREGLHPCERGVSFEGGTGSTHDTLTTKNHHRTTKEPSGDELAPVPPPAPPPVPRDLLDDAVAIWNSICGQRNGMVIRLSDARRTLLKARMRDMPEPGAWPAYCRRIAASSFLSGDNDRKWRADFDWVLKASTCLRILEGKYDDRPGDRRSSGGADAGDDRSWAMRGRRRTQTPWPDAEGPIIDGDQL